MERYLSVIVDIADINHLQSGPDRQGHPFKIDLGVSCDNKDLAKGLVNLKQILEKQ